MRLRPFFFSIVLFFLFAPASVRGATFHHEINAKIDPAQHQLQITDTITVSVPEGSSPSESLKFLLHAGLNPVSQTEGVTLAPEALKNETESADVPLEQWRVNLPEGVSTFVLSYTGSLNHPLKEEGESYGRSFRETPGIISETGVFLAGASFWYPVFGDALVTFALDVQMPAAWVSVSQGTRTFHEIKEDATQSRWHSPEAQEEIYLVAGQWTEYTRAAGNVTAMAFLREPDAALAEKYLATTEQYLEMYQKLLGPYPYKKFALVENFWETGYGMPSFTLLGSKIIRMPFILHSSYPHEILHNWWGNGVYVDYAQGNWAEGLTTYLADHLIAEQRGSGTLSRRRSLQKYTDYVSKGKDFPLTAFRQRESAATEAVGYGKTLMLFHMLRTELGDVDFVAALRDFYRTHRFERADFSDLEKAFSKAAKKDLSPVFFQWVTQAGAPQLAIKRTSVRKSKKGFRLVLTLQQQQAGPAYVLSVPIAVTLEGHKQAEQLQVSMNKKEKTFKLRFPHRPVRLAIDPEFDLFRRLDRNEIPPALSRAFGAEKVLIILPSKATAPLQEAYDALARKWQDSASERVEVTWDTDLDALPSDRSVWLFGWKNHFHETFSKTLAPYETSLKTTEVYVDGKNIAPEGHAFVLTNRHPDNPDLALSWLGTDNPAALPGLARKLPHYGRYSYLGFEGDAPTNVLKGVWPLHDSPLSVVIGTKDAEAGRLKKSTALATLPSLFSKERMMADIEFLAGDEMKGRGFGTPELDKAADYIRDVFQKAGLKPLGDAGSYFQSWPQKGGEPEKEAMLKNVVALLPGSDEKYTGESVVIGAHYDHLGQGWPDAHEGDTGKIHPGADDNASGVAVLLELARILGSGFKPERSVIFVAFSAEEMQALGAKHYVDTIKDFPPSKIMGMLNMDTVGRLGDNKLTVFGAKSSPQWPHIFRGIGFVTGIPINTVMSDFNPSDQFRFHEVGVPAVQLHSSGNTDFHRPSDTIDKIDAEGLTKVAKVMKEAVEYLSSRPDPLTSTLTAGGENARPAASPPQRKVGIGTIPDFEYEGKGVRISGTSPDSPAQKAGLKANDIIHKIGKNDIKDIRAFANVLRDLEVGVAISLTFVRADQEMTISIVPEKR